MCNCDRAAVEEWLITDALEFVDWVLDPVVLVFIICMYFCLCFVNISVTVTNLFKSGCNRKLNIRRFSMCYQVWQFYYEYLVIESYSYLGFCEVLQLSQMCFTEMMYNSEISCRIPFHPFFVWIRLFSNTLKSLKWHIEIDKSIEALSIQELWSQQKFRNTYW